MRCQSPVRLRFNEDGKFRILALGDSHEKLKVTEKTEDMLNLLNAAAENLHPDAVIFMGDLVQRENEEENRAATDDEMFEQVERLTKPFTSRGIPVGIVFGNHDGDPPAELKQNVFRLRIRTRVPGGVLFLLLRSRCQTGNVRIRAQR